MHKVLQIALGEDVEPDKPPDDGKDPAAVALGRKGGLKGGKARWEGVPAKCLGMKREARVGLPDADQIITSFVEKHNQTMRKSMRRYTRLTAGHSKKVENHRCATALHVMHYNFARICQSIRCTPAIQAGISDHQRSIEELVSLSN